MPRSNVVRRSLAATAFLTAICFGAEGTRTIWHLVPSASDHDHASIAATQQYTAIWRSWLIRVRTR